MGESPLYSSLSVFPGPSSYSVIAPFAADITISTTGSVKYTQFTFDQSQLNAINSFIQSETESNFQGTRILVAEWNSVPLSNGLPVSLEHVSL